MRVGKPLVGLLNGNEDFYCCCPGDPQGASLHLKEEGRPPGPPRKACLRKGPGNSNIALYNFSYQNAK